MCAFKAVFEAYGADYDTTIARFMHKEDMYLRFLDMMFEDKSLQLLGDALEHSDIPAAFGHAHTLKGVVGNMGLTPLYKAACAIVEVLRRRDEDADYKSLYHNIELEYQKADELRGQLKAFKEI